MAKKKSTVNKQTELLAVEVPVELVRAMDSVGIVNRDEYIRFLIASSLLNYQKVFTDDKTEKEISKIKEDSDHENYLR